jgi:PEGA domain
MTRRATLLFAAALASILPGCIEQRYVIESDPPGALVLVNGQPIGTTPVDGYYIYYGAYDFTLVKDGYQTKVVRQKITMPWFEYPGVDFITENVYPGKVEDVRRFKYCLEPLVQVSEGDLLNQAQQLRNRGKSINGGDPGPQP